MTNKRQSIHEAAQTVLRVAQTLERKGDNKFGQELKVIAQFLDGTGSTGSTMLVDGASGDGLQREGDGIQETQMGRFDPSQEIVSARDGEHPIIQPFARHKEHTNPSVVHQVQVQFTAPEGVTETDMLNYILGIRDKLGVDASNVQWSKKEQNLKSSV